MRHIAIIVVLLLLMGCGSQPAEPVATPEPTVTVVEPLVATATPEPTATTAPTATAAPTATVEPTATPEPTATAEPTATTEPTVVPLAEDRELIYIESPGQGSVVTSPIRVAGIADPTFEQNLVVRLVTIDGVELALQPTTILADAGQRGPFEREIVFSVAGVTPAWIQVFHQSARDGGIVHLSSVAVRLSPTGPADIRPAGSNVETIQIFSPAPGETVSGGSVTVEGFGLASFEQTLEVNLLDESGRVIARRPLIVNAPDLGVPGPFSVTIPYSVSSAAPARVMVRDVSPAFGGTTHLSSVEIRLEP